MTFRCPKTPPVISERDRWVALLIIKRYGADPVLASCDLSLNSDRRSLISKSGFRTAHEHSAATCYGS